MKMRRVMQKQTLETKPDQELLVCLFFTERVRQFISKVQRFAN